MLILSFRFNGGPGCSSLSGLLSENGPFTWESGTIAPTQNPYTWVNLTNMMWVEQPVGVGFSQGVPNITNEVELGQEFIGFYKSFVDAFQVQNRKVYLTGESYGGFYVPYIADAFINANDPVYYNLAGVAINDPILGDNTLQEQGMKALPFLIALILTPRSGHTSIRRLLVQPLLPKRHLLQSNPCQTGRMWLYSLYRKIPPVPSSRPFPRLTRPLQVPQLHLRHLRRPLQRPPLSESLLQHLPRHRHLPPPMEPRRRRQSRRLCPPYRGRLLQPQRCPESNQRPTHQMAAMYQHQRLRWPYG